MGSLVNRLPQWIDLEKARAALKGGTGKAIRIAIIDSGVETSHPELGALHLADDVQIYSDGVKVAMREGDGSDLYGHGTAVAGVLSQIAREAEIGSFRVLNENLGSRTIIIREGVRQAIDRGYHILNCSFGCGVMEHIFQYKEWIDEAYLKGIHIVSACNNNNYRKPEWPGYFPSVVTVNMARTSDMSALFYKPGHLVEFAACGVNVRLPWNRGLLQGSDWQQLCCSKGRWHAGQAAFRVPRAHAIGGKVGVAPVGRSLVQRNFRFKLESQHSQ
jgi:subtilisin family serine protease